jgi:hypothetical protein
MPKVQYIRHDRLPTLSAGRHRLATELLATIGLWAEFCKRHDCLVAGVEVAAIIAGSSDNKDSLGHEAREMDSRLLAVAQWVDHLRRQIETTMEDEWERREYPSITRFPRPPAPSDKV